MKAVIIQASARNDGDTSAIAQKLAEVSSWPIINIKDYEILEFDYEHKNQNDDFLPLMKNLISNYDTFVFLTPVYWYAMSSQLKLFLDRFTDLITIEKPLGRKLREKQMVVVSTSAGGNLGEQFWIPFKEMANYLGISYLGNLHTYNGKTNNEEIEEFIGELQIKTK